MTDTGEKKGSWTKSDGRFDLITALAWSSGAFVADFPIWWAVKNMGDGPSSFPLQEAISRGAFKFVFFLAIFYMIHLLKRRFSRRAE